jgi:tol-pal system protein YbgF
MPALRVEVAGPVGGSAMASPRAAASAGAQVDGERVVGIADDGTEIVYEGEAALGHAAPPISPSALTAGDGDDSPAPVPAHRARMASAPVPASSPDADPPTAPAGDRIEVTRRIPPISARAAIRSKTRDVAGAAPHDAPGDRGGDAATEYRSAVDLLKSGKHDDAITALRAFIAKYPRHDYADNAQYWLGEAFYAQKDYARALTEFRTVIEVYPRGNKVPDALLKVGYCYLALGQGEKAHAVLEQVVTRYPKSEPATLAAKRLETP